MRLGRRSLLSMGFTAIVAGCASRARVTGWPQARGVEVCPSEEPNVAAEGFEIERGRVRLAGEFHVLLADNSCSTHPHWVTVAAGAYLLEALVELSTRSRNHVVAFTGQQLVDLFSGASVPFSTIGDERGKYSHSHCGRASRAALPGCDYRSEEPPTGGPSAGCDLVEARLCKM